MKISGKRRLEPEWSISDWCSLDGAGSILGLGPHFVSIGSPDGTDAREIIGLIYIVR